MFYRVLPYFFETNNQHRHFASSGPDPVGVCFVFCLCQLPGEDWSERERERERELKPLACSSPFPLVSNHVRFPTQQPCQLEASRLRMANQNLASKLPIIAEKIIRALNSIDDLDSTGQVTDQRVNFRVADRFHLRTWATVSSPGQMEAVA